MIIQTRLECQMDIDFPAVIFSGYTLILGKERKIRRRVFTSPTLKTPHHKEVKSERPVP